MSAPRFFVDPTMAALADGVDVALPESVARHATQVLRLRDGDAVVLFDGRGGEFPGTLSVQGRHAVARLRAHAAIERESPRAVALVQAIVAPDVMDWIVRKAVELGAASIVPVQSARTQRAPADRLDRRRARWQQIAIAACEQCGRNRLPDVAVPSTFDAWLRAQPGLGMAVLLDPAATASLAATASAAAPTMVIVGPEGGWTAGEVDDARAAGARTAHLGVRTLRAETAALAALATLEALAG